MGYGQMLNMQIESPYATSYLVAITMFAAFLNVYEIIKCELSKVQNSNFDLENEGQGC